jgi:iron(III) transport system substrate-binding protein
MVAKFFFYNPKLGPGLLKKLYGDAEVTFSRDFRLLTDWLAKGKFALCIGCRDIKKAKAQGLPVDEFDNNVWSEGAALTVSGNTLSLLNQAPHPHAARVFINWFLSKKGQMVYQELSAPDDPPNSLRIDIPKDGIPKQNRLFAHVTYFDLASPEFADMAPVYRLLDEILKGR